MKDPNQHAKLTPGARLVLHRLAQSVALWRPGEPFDWRALVTGLQRYAHLDECAVYGVEVVGQSFALSQFENHGFYDADRARLGMAEAVGVGRPWGCFDPLHPDAAERNNLQYIAGPPAAWLTDNPDPVVVKVMHGFMVMGVGFKPQLRVLLCDGPNLLAWLGGTTSRRPGVESDHFLLAAAEVARPRLRWEQALGRATWSWAAVTAMLESLGRPAWLATNRGTLLTANSAAVQRWNSAGREFRSELAQVAAGAPRPGWQVLRVQGSEGMPEVLLLLEAASAVLPSQISALQLTPRQHRVAELLVTGSSNRHIARTLGCSEKTVETHVTAILRRAGVPSTAAFAAAIAQRHRSSPSE